MGPGRRAFGSSGRGRALAFFSPPPQALSAKTARVTSSPSLRACRTILRDHICCSSYSTFPTAIVTKSHFLVSRTSENRYGEVRRISLLEQIAWSLDHAPSWGHESALRRSAQEGSRGRRAERDG